MRHRVHLKDRDKKTETPSEARQCPRKQRNRDQQPELRLVDQQAQQSAGTWAMSASGVVSSRSTGG